MVNKGTSWEKTLIKIDVGKRVDTCKMIKLDTNASLTKFNSKWIKDVNTRPEIEKFLEANVG